MNFCAVIPDRGDRPELTAFCFQQLDRMTVKPDRTYHINYAPLGPGFDLIDRVAEGVFRAQKDGFDWVFVIENDDFYPATYFKRFLPHLDKYDFIGQNYTTYYNLQNCTYNTFDHSLRSSLFTTAFRISALNNFEWPDNSKPFLDIALWKYARHRRRNTQLETGALGIKHGLGLCGGKGHTMTMKNKDEGLTYLRQHTDEMGYEFYKRMIEKLKVRV